MFTTYVAVWLPYILVEISTGTRTIVTVIFKVTRTSAVQCLSNREILLGWFKATRYTALALMIRVRENIIKDIIEILICFS